VNPNVEVINPHLLGVRFDWLKAGLIPDLPLLLPKDQRDNDVAQLTVDGVLLFNKNASTYDYAKCISHLLMRKTDAYIERQMKKPGFNPKGVFYHCLIYAENTRRILVKKSKGKSFNQLRQELNAVERELNTNKREGVK